MTSVDANMRKISMPLRHAQMSLVAIYMLLLALSGPFGCEGKPASDQPKPATKESQYSQKSPSIAEDVGAANATAPISPAPDPQVASAMRFLEAVQSDDPKSILNLDWHHNRDLFYIELNEPAFLVTKKKTEADQKAVELYTKTKNDRSITSRRVPGMNLGGLHSLLVCKPNIEIIETKIHPNDASIKHVFVRLIFDITSPAPLSEPISREPFGGPMSGRGLCLQSVVIRVDLSTSSRGMGFGGESKFILPNLVRGWEWVREADAIAAAGALRIVWVELPTSAPFQYNSGNSWYFEVNLWTVGRTITRGEISVDGVTSKFAVPAAGAAWGSAYSIPFHAKLPATTKTGKPIWDDLSVLLSVAGDDGSTHSVKFRIPEIKKLGLGGSFVTLFCLEGWRRSPLTVSGWPTIDHFSMQEATADSDDAKPSGPLADPK